MPSHSVQGQIKGFEANHPQHSNEHWAGRTETTIIYQPYILT